MKIPAQLVAAICSLACFAAGASGQCPASFFQYTTAAPQELAPGNNVVFGAYDVPAMIMFDPDGPGPQAPYLIAAIHYIGPADCANQFTISSEWCRLDRLDSATNTWIPLTERFDGIVNCMTTFDDDGAGPNPPRLYIGGRFGGMGPAPWAIVNSPNLVKFDGEFFDFANQGLNGEVHSMLVFDDDGPGPVLPKLYVGGDFSSAPATTWQGQVDAQRLIRLTGTNVNSTTLRWENPSAGFGDRVFALCSFDEDGPGPGLPRLVAAGAFRSNNGDNNQRLIARYDGASWAPFSQGLDAMAPDIFSGRRVFSLCEFDEDGSGPQLPSLFVGGSIYQTTEGQVSPLVIRWRRNAATGNAGWLSVPSPPDLVSQSDSDSCSQFCSNTPIMPSRPRVLSMHPFDADGTGQPVMYIGTGTGNHRLMQWDPATNTTTWVLGNDGSFLYIAALSMLELPATSNVPGRLLIAGGRMGSGVPVTCVSCPPAQGCPFSPINLSTTVGPSSIFAWGRSGTVASITNQPDNGWVNVTASSGSAGFATLVSGTGPFTYRWRKDGVDLANGTGQGFGSIIGATGPAVIIGGTTAPVNTTAQGWYDCRIGNDCGNRSTVPAWLVVQPDATPYFPIRFDSPVAPVTTAIGNADMQYIFVGAPYPRFYTTVSGTPFAIAPTGNNAWRGRLAAGSADGNRGVTIPVSRYGVGEVYTLLNTDGSSSTNVRLAFNATGGLVYTTTLAGGNSVRSYSKFYGPQTVASDETTNVFDNGINQMDKQRVVLPNAFRLQTLTSITVTDLGTDATGRAILAGLTLVQRPPACGPADLGSVGGQRGADGVLDNNDFVVFIDLYFNGDFTADFGSTGGISGPDGRLDNNDFIVFIDMFFAGC